MFHQKASLASDIAEVLWEVQVCLTPPARTELAYQATLVLRPWVST